MKKIIMTLCLLIPLIILVNNIECKANNSKYSMDVDLIKQISENVPNYTKIDKIPQNLKNAIIAVEDRRFYSHQGFDSISIARAFVKNLRYGSIKEGASTITQQLVKNLFLSNERSFNRKFKELVLAVKLENKYSKEQILEMYLNVIYYGNGAYGIQNASKTYFNKDVSKLSLEECAMLAGLPQSPNNYNPKKHLEKAKKRQKIVIDAMVRNKFIESDQFNERLVVSN